MQRTNTRSGMYPLMYYNHNVHFESYAAAMAGQYARARRTADKLTANVTPFIAEMPMIEGFIPQQYFVLLRFAKWDEILALAGARGVAAADDRHLALRARRGASRARGDRPARALEQQPFLDGVAKIRPRRRSAC